MPSLIAANVFCSGYFRSAPRRSAVAGNARPTGSSLLIASVDAFGHEVVAARSDLVLLRRRLALVLQAPGSGVDGQINTLR